MDFMIIWVIWIAEIICINTRDLLTEHKAINIATVFCLIIFLKFPYGICLKNNLNTPLCSFKNNFNESHRNVWHVT